MSFDFPDISERHGGEIERFLLSVEQLEEGIRLLRTGRAAHQRMALVAFDTLAEGLLFRHMDALFFVSDEPIHGIPRTYTATERRQARQKFKKRVALATETFEGIWSFRYPKPILDNVDAAIFRVAHHYRNPVYHEDRHNPTLIEPIGRLYAQAVGRVFVRSQREGYGVSCSRAQLEECTRLGWQGEKRMMFYPRAAAEAIRARICKGLDVDRDQLGTNLAEDIGYRCDMVEGDIIGLRRDGLSEDRLRDFLIDAQDWAANRGDETMLRLQSEHQVLEDAAMIKGEFDEETRLALRALERQQWDHLFGPERKRRSQVDLDSHEQIRGRGASLRRWRGALAGLLEKYQRLDLELEIMEEALDWMIMQWDRHLQLEMDEARGK